MKMRISRQSVGRRRSLLTKSLSNALSRTTRRDGGGPSSLLFRDRWFLLIAASLFVSCLNFLTRSKYRNQESNDDGGRGLRSSSANSRTQPTPLPKSVVESMNKRFDPADFRRKNLTAPPDASAIIFYNLFVPDEAEGAKHAVEVITEQLGQVASSLRKSEEDDDGRRRATTRPAVLFYNLIGNEREMPPSRMERLCQESHPELRCERMDRYESASESVTLQDVHDFCQNDAAANSRVTYIHSKGSYHQTEVNTNWRRALTDAVVHPDCLSPPDDTCNVCGAQFYTRFATMYPGNMWTAECSYVRRLLPPMEGREYDVRKRESVVKFLKYRLWGQLNSTLLDDRVDYYGLGRFRLEHWIGSHPSIRPCELHGQNVTFEQIITGQVTPADYDWGMGPRRDDVVDELPEVQQRIAEDEDAQFREYFFLPGNLLKWFTLYGSDGVPSPSSWAWKFFPGGGRWKKLVDRYGENAVEEMASRSSHGYHSAFESKNNGGEEFRIDQDDEKLFSDPVPPLVVFYHITIPKVKKMQALLALKTQLELLALGQYDIISRSYHRQRQVILYYTIAGNSTGIGFLDELCDAKSRQLTCRKVGEFDSERPRGESLRQLHNFCLAKPSSRVTYLSNTLPGTYGVNKTEAYSMQKIRAYTTAVTSNMCLKSRDTCNVCGTEFYPLPYNHFIGNMFTASCGYVKDLLPPEDFERAMNHAAGDTLVSQLLRSVTTELFPFTPQNLGLDQYSVEHWIGSHPDFEPCDVAPVRHSWFPLFTGGSYLATDYSSSRAYDFMWSQAPRRSSAPVGSLGPKREKEATEKDKTAFREYFYLAGNLFRWYELYDRVPPPTSWVWQFHPRGKEWMEGVKQHGPDAVTTMSRPFWDPNEGVPF